MTNPIYFEDPRTLTEARFIYFHHKVPLAAAGGDVDLFAVQLRAALTIDCRSLRPKTVSRHPAIR